MRSLAAVLLVTACASAGAPDQPVDANGSTDGNQVELDAMADAPSGPQTRTLSQTTSDAIKAANTIACGNNAAGWTSVNNYYRVFDLAGFGITTPFTVEKVTFKYETCDRLNAVGNCTNVAVRVGTYATAPGTTLNTQSISILASNATVPIPEGTNGTVDAPITATIPAGQRLLVEVDAPDGTNIYKLYMGSNDGGESAPGYILAPSTGCDVTVPTSISQIGGAPIHLLLTVTGTY